MSSCNAPWAAAAPPRPCRDRARGAPAERALYVAATFVGFAAFLQADDAGQAVPELCHGGELLERR